MLPPPTPKVPSEGDGAAWIHDQHVAIAAAAGLQHPACRSSRAHTVNCFLCLSCCSPCHLIHKPGRSLWTKWLPTFLSRDD